MYVYFYLPFLWETARLNRNHNYRLALEFIARLIFFFFFFFFFAISQINQCISSRTVSMKITIKTTSLTRPIQSKKISNDQELIQSDPISCPQNQKGNN